MEQQGYEVAFAADPYLGLILVDETGPDMVILDAAVAGSLRFCAHIRKLVFIPVILMGSDPPSKAWEQSVDEGADAYVSVFTDPAEVVATVGSILHRYQKTRGQAASL
jgi:DNA-binding response OmpR family regulator